MVTITDATTLKRILLYLYTDDYDDGKIKETWDPLASRTDASSSGRRE